MTQAIQKCFTPLMTMNRRVLVGGGVLALVLFGESTVALIGPFA